MHCSIRIAARTRFTRTPQAIIVILFTIERISTVQVINIISVWQIVIHRYIFTSEQRFHINVHTPNVRWRCAVLSCGKYNYIHHQ